MLSEWACYFSTCLLQRLLLWRDAKGPAGGQAFSTRPPFGSAASSTNEGCGRWAGEVAETISHAVRSGDDSLALVIS